MSIFKTLDRTLIFIVNPILIVIGLAVPLMLTIGIFSRAVVGAPVFGLEEIMLIAVMWFYMLGASLASRERSHLRADFIKVLSQNPTVWRVADIVSTVISLFVAIFFVLWSFDLFAWGVMRGQSTPVFGLPWVISQGSLFVASILFVCYLVRDLVFEFTGQQLPHEDPRELEPDDPSGA